eukprot:Rmarinus@m.3176
MGGLDFETEAAIKEHSSLLKAQNQKYLQDHPEIRQMLDDFLTACLVKRPANLYKFAGWFFSTYVPSQAAARSTTHSKAMRLPPLVVCGPSGVGKSTLIQRLMHAFPDDFGFSVSHTTRAPRSGEKNGVHYHFIDKTQMLADIQEGKFIEHAEVHGNLYGTSLAAVQSVGEAGRICVLDIDVQGVRQVKQTELQPLCLFVAPPDLAELQTRLKKRGTESEESLTRRLENAKEEIEASKEEGFFDKVIVNDSIDSAFKQLTTSLSDLFRLRRRVALLQAAQTFDDQKE